MKAVETRGGPVKCLVSCCLQLGLNVMADLTNDEYRQHFLGTRVPEERLNRSSSTDGRAIIDFNLDDVPQTMDWRQHNAVTQVKNQESVGDRKVTLCYMETIAEFLAIQSFGTCLFLHMCSVGYCRLFNLRFPSTCSLPTYHSL